MLVTMLWTALVILAALIEYMVFGFLVGGARARYKVMAPATSGHPDFERTFRVHYNTLEMLVVFVPAIWLFGMYLNPRWGAIVGAVFVVGRALYAIGYIRAAEKREVGAMLSFAALAVLLAGAVFGVVRALWLVGT
ncbi:MAG TPA: MAPEG family protein [Steroidobacteraceae bacterium]|jgi:glutathione S-transferase|nr:MAPEG family protein [Steroidobacteraceae bacterium]